jgi:hypothetical protein
MCTDTLCLVSARASRSIAASSGARAPPTGRIAAPGLAAGLDEIDH